MVAIFQCKKRHSLICREYQRNGECAKGKRCPLRHIKPGRRKRKSETKAPKPWKRDLDQTKPMVVEKNTESEE